jgi:shikimate dehydrogenase
MKNKLALLGKNIEHSRSPLIHSFIMNYLNIGGSYELLEFNNKLNPNYLGFNVTTPYKIEIIKYLDEITPLARNIGAINTIYKENNKWIGTNTDYDGFKYLLEINNIDVKSKNIYILGSGGAAFAVYKVIEDLKGNPVIVTRNKQQLLNNKNHIFYDDLNPSEVDIYVQATNINPNESVLSKAQVENHLVIELQVNKNKTKIEQYAKSSINGLEMLIFQALKSAEIWFKKDIINNDIIKSLKEVIEK